MLNIKNLLFWSTTVVLVVVIVGVIMLGLSSKPMGDDTKTLPVTQPQTVKNEETKPVRVPNIPSQQAQKTMELKIEDLVVGTGAQAVFGKQITVNYIGTLINGTKFDSSYDRSQPFKFTLGAGQVIAGWDKGFAGMKVGGKRRLTIPADLGYGSAGAGPLIPPNSTLIFEVELLDVAK